MILFSFAILFIISRYNYKNESTFSTVVRFISTILLFYLSYNQDKLNFPLYTHSIFILMCIYGLYINITEIKTDKDKTLKSKLKYSTSVILALFILLVSSGNLFDILSV